MHDQWEFVQISPNFTSWRHQNLCQHLKPISWVPLKTLLMVQEWMAILTAMLMEVLLIILQQVLFLQPLAASITSWPMETVTTHGMDLNLSLRMTMAILVSLTMVMTLIITWVREESLWNPFQVIHIRPIYDNDRAMICNCTHYSGSWEFRGSCFFSSHLYRFYHFFIQSHPLDFFKGFLVHNDILSARESRSWIFISSVTLIVISFCIASNNSLQRNHCPSLVLDHHRLFCHLESNLRHSYSPSIPFNQDRESCYLSLPLL